MIKARPQHDGRLEFVEIGDFSSPAGLLEAVSGIDAIIHTASVSKFGRGRVQNVSNVAAIHI